jgi:hypothetical protein
MDETQRKSLAEKLDLPEDATEEQINTALQQRELADPGAVDESGSNPPPGESGEKPKEYPPVATGPHDATEEGAPESGSGNVTNAKVNEDGTVTMDKGTFDYLVSGAQAALGAQAANRKREIADVVQAAVRSGRIPPARGEHWAKALEADFEGSKAVLDGMPEGLIPVNTRGAAGSEEQQVGNNGGEGLPDEWFPALAAQRNAQRPGSRIMIAKEG